MEQLQQSILKQLQQLTPTQLSQLTPQQINQIKEITQYAQLAQLAQQKAAVQQQQNQKGNQPNNVPNQQNLLQQQQEQLLAQARLAASQQQANQTPLTPQQLVYQQLSQNVNFSSSFPPTLVPPQNPANLYAYGYVQQPLSANANGPVNTEIKYKQLLAVIEEMSKDMKPIISGSKTSAERFKRLIVQARLLVRECLNDVNNQANAGNR